MAFLLDFSLLMLEVLGSHLRGFLLIFRVAVARWSEAIEEVKAVINAWSLEILSWWCEFLFAARTVQRMELLVLSTLKFRMQAVTPFSLMDYFLYKFSNENSPKKFLILQSADLILTLIRGN
ncbi:cyclin-D4-1-like [Carex rostrata]